MAEENIFRRPPPPPAHECTGCPKIMVPRLCNYFGRAVDYFISVFMQLLWSGFNLGPCLSHFAKWLLLMVGKRQYLWLPQKALPLYSSNAKLKFQRKDSGTILKFLPHILNGRKCSLVNRKHCQPFEAIGKNLNTTPEPFLWKQNLPLLENDRNAVFEAIIYSALLGSKSARFARALTFLAPAECFLWLPYSIRDHHLNSA